MEQAVEKMKAERRESKSEKHPAAVRCQAVLSVWTEHRKPGEVCRELGIKWMTLMHWQKRAMEGMLQALTPRVPLTQGRSLPPRLLAMLARQEAQLTARLSVASAGPLTRRLQRIQEKRRETGHAAETAA